MESLNVPCPRRKVSSVTFRHNTRFIVLAATILALIFASANTILFNFTVICMTEDTAENKTSEIFDQNEKGVLYSAVAIGTLISCLVIMKLISILGGRLTFVIYGFISGIATLAFPLAVNYGVIPVFLMRTMQGIGNGMAFASIGYVSSAWCPIRTSGVFLTALTSYNQLAPLMTMPLAGFFCTSSYGWQMIYYIQGVLTIVSYIFFYFVHKDQPRFHQHVSDKELFTIEHKKSVTSIDKKGTPPPAPYWEMMKDKFVLGTLVACIGDFVCFNIFVLFAPVYLNKVLGLDIAETGIMSAIPYLGSLVVKILIGPISDGLKGISTLNSVRLFMSISQISMTLCLTILGLIPTEWIFFAQFIYLIAIVFSAFNAVGYYKSVQLSSGPFASTIMSWFAVIYSIVILLLPIFKTLLVREDEVSQWRIFFFIASGICFVTLIIWIFTAEVELRPWAVVPPKLSTAGFWENQKI